MTARSVKTSTARGGATRFELPGGAVGFVESSSAVPLVSIVVGLRSGGVTDPDGKDGLCRLMTRMLRRGAAGLTSAQIEEAIDQLGAELSLDVGPSTTTLHAQVIRRNVVPFCELLARVLGQPAFAADELSRLKRETIAELLDARDSDRALASIAFRRALFGAHPFARAAAGRPTTVDKLERPDVTASYAQRFVRGDLVIGFAGAVSEAEALTLGTTLANALPEGPRSTLTLAEPSVVTPGRRLVFVDKPDRTQTQILIGALGSSPHDADHHDLAAAVAVLGGTFTSRMMREIRSKRGWSYGTSARLSIERRRHAFVMSAAPAANDCAPCVELELSMLEDFARDGIAAKELAFIKNYLVRSHAFEVDTAPKRLGQALEVELLDLPADYHSAYVDHVRAVTVESANDAVRKRLSPDDLVVVVVGTSGELLEKVQRSVSRLVKHEVVPYDAD